MEQLYGTATIIKPVKVHWFLWKGLTPTNFKELKSWIESFNCSFEEVVGTTMSGGIVINPGENTTKLYALPNDYIIMWNDVEQEFLVFEKEEFKKIYKIDL